MSEEEQVNPCVHCNEYNEQMLMVQCMHDPCINCAAIHYVENAPKNSLFYPCAKCNDETQLDSSSVVELQKVYKTLKPPQQEAKKFDYGRNISKKTPTMNSKSQHPYSSEGKNSRTKYSNDPDNFEPYDYRKGPNNLPVATSDKYQYEPSYAHKTPQQPQYSNYSPSYQPSSYTNTHSKKIGSGHGPSSVQVMCPDHPEDELTYFCFTCNKPICPECAIHGSHKDHDVQTTRRAIKQIKGRLNEINEELSGHIGELVNRKQEGRRSLKDLSEQNKRDHEEIKRHFARLRGFLAEKEKDFTQVLNESYEKGCEEIKHYGSSMDKMVEGYNVVRRSIDMTLKRDDLTVLQEFNKREQESIDVLDKNRSIGNETQPLEERRVDYPLLEDELDQVSGLLQGLKLTMAHER